MDINQLLKLKDEEIQGHLQVNEKLRAQVTLFQKAFAIQGNGFTRLLSDASPLLPTKDNVEFPLVAETVVNHKRSISVDSGGDAPLKRIHHCQDQFSLVKRIATTNSAIKIYMSLGSPFDPGNLFILSNDLANSLPKSTRLPADMTPLNINWPIFRKWSKSEMKESIHQRVTKCYLLDSNLQRFILRYNWELGSALLKLIS